MSENYDEAAFYAFDADPLAATQAAIDQGQSAVIQAAAAEAAELRTAQQVAMNTANLAIDSLRRTNGETFTKHEDRIARILEEQPHLIPDEARYDADVAEKALANVWAIADRQAAAENAQSKDERDRAEFNAIQAAGHQPYWKALKT